MATLMLLGGALSAEAEAGLREALRVELGPARRAAPGVTRFDLRFDLAEAPPGLRGQAEAWAQGHALDAAVLAGAPGRVPVRLAVMDMDSTLVRIEVIDELARAHGVVEQVSRITERAMQGELDYDTSLRLRLELLRGLPLRVLEELAANLPLSDGAEALVSGLRAAGVKTAVVSGGFDVAARALGARLGVDVVRSNVLEVAGGRLTGNVVGPVVNGGVKRATLEALAAEAALPREAVVAVGDGANDIPMLQAAGLGVAFRAKPRVRAAADVALDRSGLDAVLPLLGLPAAA